MFKRSKWDNAAKTQGMLQSMPINKQSSFVHINSWEEFKKKLINNFGNTNVFRHEAFRQFTQMDQPLQTVQELADILVPTINTLKSHVQRVATFHDHDLLYTNALSPTLIDTLLSCIPPSIPSTFFSRFSVFKIAKPQNQSAVLIFYFISDELFAVVRSNTSYPLDLDYITLSHKVNVKLVRVQQPNFTRNQQQSSFTH